MAEGDQVAAVICEKALEAGFWMTGLPFLRDSGK
jgi:hypothetical protein